MGTSETILGDPVAEIAGQVNRIRAIDVAGTMFFVEKLCHKIVTD
jgi:hypothetical protein